MYCVPFLSAAYLFCTNCFLIPMRTTGCVHFAHAIRTFEPPHEKKKTICICKNKGADQLRINCGADQCLCFSTWIVQFLYFLNPKFPASYHLLILYRPVCVRPGRNPNYWFSHAQAHKRGRRSHRRNLDNLD